MPNLPYYVRGLALGIIAILAGLQLSGWLFIIPAIRDGHSDFRQLYTSAYMVRTGHAHELYDYQAQKAFQDQLVSSEEIALPFIRPASQALFFAPISVLPYRTAYVVFLFVNLLLLAAAYRLLRRRMENLAKIYQWLPAAMFMSFLPVAAALIQGQDSILLLFLFAAAAVSLERNRDLTAGVLAGLGLFKFQIVIPIAVLFFFWRRWRFSAGVAISAAATASVSLWLVGLAQIGTLEKSLVSLSTGSTARLGASAASRIPLSYATYATGMANLRGLIFCLTDSFLPASWVQAITIVASAVVFLIVAIIAPRKQSGAEAFLMAIATSVFVSYYLFIHDLSVMLIPIAFTLNRFTEAEAAGDAAGRRMARVSALMFTAPAMISFLPFHFYLVALPLGAFLFVMLQRMRAEGVRAFLNADCLVKRST
jgi:hypothetical protein